jgi:RNA polymerase sigma-70 factor (ECF subfamily)
MSARREALEPAEIDQTRRRVFGLCRLLLGSVPQAEDATGEVFVKAQRAIDSYDPTMPFVAWALTIARNHCMDLLRRRKVEQRLFSGDEPGEAALTSPSPSPLGELLRREERDHVRAALATLGDRARTALVLHYYEELGYEEIGRTLGLTRQGVATLVFRAKRELRERVAALAPGGTR